MNKDKVVKWSGWFGLLGVIVFAVEFPLWILPGTPPQISDAVAHSQFLANIRLIAMTRILLDVMMFVCLMIFFAGLRYLIIKTRPEHEWIATLNLIAGAIWWATSLVADGLEGGAVLDTLGGTVDPTVVRALVEGTVLIYNGSIQFMTIALFMSTAGYGILASRALPIWTGWFAWISAILCIIAVPSMYGTVVDHRGFYNVGGWGNAIIANVPPLIWFFVVSISMIRKRLQTNMEAGGTSKIISE